MLLPDACPSRCKFFETDLICLCRSGAVSYISLPNYLLEKINCSDINPLKLIVGIAPSALRDGLQLA